MVVWYELQRFAKCVVSFVIGFFDPPDRRSSAYSFTGRDSAGCSVWWGLEQVFMNCIILREYFAVMFFASLLDF